MLKTSLKSLLFIAVCSAPLAANASNLTITNNTTHDSTSIINNGACSTILGESGITRAGKTNVIDESKIKLACLFNKKNCKADVYMTENCSGPKIATVIFDTNSGVKSVEVIEDGYNIIAAGFTISLNSK